MPQGRRDIADLVKRCMTLERERDEARQWARVMLTERNDWRHEAERLCAERDEALAVCTELAEACQTCTSRPLHLAIYPVKLTGW